MAGLIFFNSSDFRVGRSVVSHFNGTNLTNATRSPHPIADQSARAITAMTANVPEYSGIPEQHQRTVTSATAATASAIKKRCAELLNATTNTTANHISKLLDSLTIPSAINAKIIPICSLP